MHIGVIGVGVMGGGIARNLIRAGHDVLVYDSNEERMTPVVAYGAKACSSPAEVGRSSEIVHLVVYSGDQARQITVDDGLVYAMPAGGVVVLHPTMSPLVCQELAGVADPQGVNVIDAGMIGGADAAATGQLTLLVGGDPAVVEQIRADLDAIAIEVVHMGGPGTGMAGKILNNFVVVANLEALREACATATHLDIDPSRMINVLSRTTARSWCTQNWEMLRAVVEPTDPVDCAMSRKDVGLAIGLARDMGHDLAIMRHVYERQEELAHHFGA